LQNAVQQRHQFQVRSLVYLELLSACGIMAMVALRTLAGYDRKGPSAPPKMVTSSKGKA